MKDRIGVAMTIDEAERRGLLKPGGTIVEGTSGNTGMGLALLAAVRGYKAALTMTDEQSKEKVDLLKALGAEVIVCPTAVEPDDPRSYHAVADKLTHDLPNAYHPNQYQNPANPDVHFRTTGPEIWEDTEGKVTHFVAGMGTGGTITGVGRYLKQQNPAVKIIGADPVGSILYDFFHTGKVVKGETYKTEGIGEDFFPAALDFSVIDDILQVSDKDAFVWARRLARQEGIFAGGSAGTALVAALRLAATLKESDHVVILVPDTGQRYLSKMYNNEWMRDNRYFESSVALTARQVVETKAAPGKPGKLEALTPSDTLLAALDRMREHDLSQLPVFEGGSPVGALYEDDLLTLAMEGKDLKKVVVREVMSEAFPIISPASPIDHLMSFITRDCPAVFVEMGNGQYEILTKYDLVHAIARLIEPPK